jgi:NADPH:quinone reductase-like Zn-dependent oxidoreductase
MKSAVLKKYRSALVIEEYQSENLQVDQVRIKTAYAGISFTDRIIQDGLYKYQRKNMPLPYIPGFEASGVIVEVGEMISELSVGDKVVVLQRSGCFSSEIITKETNVIKIPQSTDLAWAASLPVNFFTAAHCLYNIVNIFPGSNLVVTSAAGGVGGMLVQLASPTHTVFGLVGTEQKKNYVRLLGAHETLTYDEFFKGSQPVDVILVSSGDNLDRYYKKLTTNGKMIMYGFHSLVPKNIKNIIPSIYLYCTLPSFKPFNLVYTNKSISGFNIIHLEPQSAEFLFIKQQFLHLLDTNTMPNKHALRVYDLYAINQALSDLAAGSTVGKVIVKF